MAANLKVPVLTFHSEFDSDAPFAWSQRLRHAMGNDRHIVRYQGGGHGVIDREQPCIADTVDAYLFDLKLPQEGLACPAEVTPGVVEGASARGLALPSEGPIRLPPAETVAVANRPVRTTVPHRPFRSRQSVA